MTSTASNARSPHASRCYRSSGHGDRGFNSGLVLPGLSVITGGIKLTIGGYNRLGHFEMEQGCRFRPGIERQAIQLIRKYWSPNAQAHRGLGAIDACQTFELYMLSHRCIETKFCLRIRYSDISHCAHVPLPSYRPTRFSASGVLSVLKKLATVILRNCRVSPSIPPAQPGISRPRKE